MIDPAAARAAERARLIEADGYDFSIEDLDATPNAEWRATFLGEHFYGATPTEAETKAHDFARDAGAVDQLAEVKIDRL